MPAQALALSVAAAAMACAPLPSAKRPHTITAHMSQVYPVCLYDTSVGAVEVAKQAWPGYQMRLESALKSIAPGSRIVFVNSREVVFTASARAHRRVQEIWPLLACYGESGGTSSSQLLDICTKYIRVLIKSRATKHTLPESVVVPACQTYAATALPRSDSGRAEGKICKPRKRKVCRGSHQE
jgi:hypothetical protein